MVLSRVETRRCSQQMFRLWRAMLWLPAGWLVVLYGASIFFAVRIALGLVASETWIDALAHGLAFGAGGAITGAILHRRRSPAGHRAK